MDEDMLTPALHYSNIVKNLDPKFTDDFNDIYTLDEGSAAINIGDPSFVGLFSDQLMFDLKGSNRLVSGAPDAGAYEK
jgi:hypothetical protein